MAANQNTENLVKAILSFNLPLVHLALGAGADPTAVVDNRDNTPLTLAARHANPEVMKVILFNSTKPIPRGALCAALAVATICDNIMCMRALLVRSTGLAGEPFCSDGLYPLHLVQSQDAAYTLLAAGAPPGAQTNKTRRTPLMAAAARGRFDLMMALGADPDVVAMVDAEGHTLEQIAMTAPVNTTNTVFVAAALRDMSAARRRHNDGDLPANAPLVALLSPRPATPPPAGTSTARLYEPSSPQPMPVQ